MNEQKTINVLDVFSGIGGFSLGLERCRDGKGPAWLPEPDVGRVAHGVSRRVDRLKALGNAVVPQVVERIGKAILAGETNMICPVIIGDCTLYQGDCLEIMPTLGTVDAVVTSPPYDDLRQYGGANFNWPDYITPIAHMLHSGSVLVWNVADSCVNGSETGSSFRQALAFMDAGLRLHDTMLYLKTNVNFPDAVRYENGFEYMFVFSNGSPKTFNPIADRPNKYAGMSMHGTDRQSDGSLRPISGLGKIINRMGKRFNWWFLTNNQPDNGHPAPMPYAMAHDHIESWTNCGNLIFDPFLGSGTTGVACAKTGRKFIGVELEPKYFDIACKRIEEAYAEPDLFVEQPEPAKQEKLI